MLIIEINPLENGAHYAQMGPPFPVPDGYAVIPESVGTMETLENFPFGDITVEVQDIGITVGEENGEVIVETIENVPVVTSWTPLPIPEPAEPAEPANPEPTMEEDLLGMALDHELRLTMLELGI